MKDGITESTNHYKVTNYNNYNYNKVFHSNNCSILVSLRRVLRSFSIDFGDARLKPGLTFFF